ncbi:MAG: hypothetical protein ACTHNU_03745 [Gaiellales bacterium]
MSSPPPSPDKRFLALRHAGQDATDFKLADADVQRFIELRDEGLDAEALSERLGAARQVIDELITADEAWAVAHRISTGQEPMYPPPEPEQRVADTRAGSARIPLAAVLVVLVAAIIYGLLR